MSKITVKSKSPRGFRRAGIHFTRDGVEIDTTNLKKGELAAIENEPNLIVIAAAESDAQRKKREAAEDAANKDALAREKAARKGTGLAAWEVAESEASIGWAPDVWTALPASERVARIEAVVAEGIPGAGEGAK